MYLLNGYMGTVTINIDDETEQKFREVVKEECGEGKGKLGQAVTEALLFWINFKKQEEIAHRQLKLIQKGFSLGKYKFDREDIHDRKN